MEMVDMIRRLACRPLKSATLTPNPLQISVQFEGDPVLVYKDSVGLRFWAGCCQHLSYERIEGDRGNCVVMPLKYFALLGFRPGDAVLLRNVTGQEQPILFS